MEHPKINYLQIAKVLKLVGLSNFGQFFALITFFFRIIEITFEKEPSNDPIPTVIYFSIILIFIDYLLNLILMYRLNQSVNFKRQILYFSVLWGLFSLASRIVISLEVLDIDYPGEFLLFFTVTTSSILFGVVIIKISESDIAIHAPETIKSYGYLNCGLIGIYLVFISSVFQDFAILLLMLKIFLPLYGGYLFLRWSMMLKPES